MDHWLDLIWPSLRLEKEGGCGCAGGRRGD